MGDYYKKGSWNAICALCGLEFKSDQLRWNSQINDYVCKDDWETRHPQERIKAVKDDQSVSWVRNDPTDVNDRGDNSITLVAGTDDMNVFFGTDLTQNRTIAISGGENGNVFQINRTGHGDYTLDVGGLVSLTNPISFAYAKVEYNGSWVLKDYVIF